MASIQTIELRDSMFEKVRNGKKIATLRKGKRDYIPGDTLLYGKKYCDMIEVTDLTYKKLDEISDEDARVEGYSKASDLIKIMKDLYPGITNDTICTQVWFVYLYTFNQ